MNWKPVWWSLAIGAILILSELGWVLYRRHDTSFLKKPAVVVDHNPEHLVFIRPSYIWNADSAHGVVGKTIWVRMGYGYRGWPLQGGRVERRDGRRGPVLLAPLQTVTVTGVVVQPWQGSRGIFLTYQDSDGPRAAKIGTESDGSASMRFDAMFLLDDPQKLYDFWSPAIWEAIRQHRVLKGMDDAQVNFALGTAQIEEDDGSRQTYYFPRDHHPIEVTLVDHKVSSFRVPAS